MSITLDERKLKAAFDFPFPFWAWPYPIDVIDGLWLAEHWGSALEGLSPPKSEYYIADHTARAIATMIEQFKPAINFKKLISVFTDNFQGIENEIENLIENRLITTAIGRQLDLLGEILNEPRLTRADDEYRSALYFKIFINISSGEPEVLITVLKTITGADHVRLIEYYPATVFMSTDGTIIPEDLTVLRKCLPVGVNINVSATYGEVCFEFPSEGGIPYDEGDGFGEYNYTEGGIEIGGKLAELILS
jgi:hypothetical protein